MWRLPLLVVHSGSSPRALGSFPLRPLSMTFARAGYEVEARRPFDLMRAHADLAHPTAGRVTRMRHPPSGRTLVIGPMAERHDDQRRDSEHQQELVREMLVVMVVGRGRGGRESRQSGGGRPSPEKPEHEL